MTKKYILGLSAFYHNSAAALILNGKIIAAAEEERFSRKKGDASFPINAVKFCLDFAGIGIDELDSIVYYENPSEKFGRIMAAAFVNIPRSVVQFVASMPEWISEKLWVERIIKKELGLSKKKIVFVPHHISHAAAAFYPSPFESAAILTIDGVGEWATAVYGVGEKEKINILSEMNFPNSLGLLYSAFTYYTGFKINNGEYKMMGLAPYGKPKFSQIIKEKLIRICDDGSIFVNQEYFSYSHGVKTINKKFEELFGMPARKAEEEITEHYIDIAASIQEVTNEILLKMASHIRKVTGKTHLVLSGGVTLNVSATGLLRRSKIFDKIWIQPAAGDAGSAIGAALYQYYSHSSEKRIIELPDSMSGSFLGLPIAEKDVEDDAKLHDLDAVWETYNEFDLCKKVALLVSEGYVVGVARGRAEFGPRALGHRSILADARNPEMLQKLNSKIKFREGFRPFAPAVIEEDSNKYFDMEGNSPYMLFTFPVTASRCLPVSYGNSVTKTASLERSDIPAVTHIDYSARVQTVSKTDNLFFYKVLQEYKRLTGYSLMVNTSFNVNEEPIVNSAVDAYRSFMRSGIDYAVIGNRFFDKAQQKNVKAEKQNEKK